MLTLDITATDNLPINLWSLYPIMYPLACDILDLYIHLKYVSCEVQFDNLETYQLMFYFMLIISSVGE